MKTAQSNKININLTKIMHYVKTITAIPCIKLHQFLLGKIDTSHDWQKIYCEIDNKQPKNNN